MGYGRTPKTVERTRPLLDEMLKSNKDIEWLFDDPQKVAYKIWEAIHYSVKSRKNELKEYTTLLNKYTIKVILPDILKAELKQAPTLSPNGMIVREVTDVLEVIAVAIEYKKDRLVFPDIVARDMDETNKEILVNWCKSNGYIFKGTPRLELIKG